MGAIKQFAFLCACFLWCTKGTAQVDFGNEHKVFEGGIVLGNAITHVTGDGYTGYHKIGIEAGGIVYINLTRSLGISMELLYVQKGARDGNVKESFYVGTYIDKYYLNLNYIELPVMLHLKQGFFNYEAGASYARLITAKEWAEADVPVVIDPELNKFNSADFEYVLGISAQISKHWHASIRYEHSIVPIRAWDRVPLRYSQYGVNEYNEITVFRMIYIL